MVQFNTRANEIVLKLVYYGPGLSGKTTNLQTLHAMCQEGQRGELFSVNTQEDRTLFFDLLPINLGTIYGNAIHLQIYTVPGQVQYDASRRVVLGGADGVVFVADSSEAKMQENVDSLSNLYHNLNANRLNIKQIPFVMQYNKRDLADAMPVGVMNRRLNFRSVPFYEAVAMRGPGVLETLVAITRETVGTTFRKYHLDKKIKDFEELLHLIETNVRSNMHELPTPEEEPLPRPEHTVLRHNTVSVDDLASGQPASPGELLEDALKSNMETARLYGELKQAKEALERKNEELSTLYGQLERANQDNLKTRRYLEGLVQGVDEGIVSFSPDGRILTWNAAAERIFGYARPEIVGHSFLQLIPQDRSGELAKVLTQLAQGATLRDVETLRVRRDGEIFPVRISYALIRGSEDRILAYSALVRDLGEQRDLERRLEHVESNAGLARVMPPLLNDVLNRLSPILIEQGRVLESLPEGPPRQHAVRLFSGIERAFDLLQPLLRCLVPLRPRLEPCDLNALVQEQLRRVETEAAEQGVLLDSILEKELPACALSPDLVREALTGLLRHGLLSASRSSVRRVRLGTRHVSGVLQVVCQDSGPLLSEEESKHLFELASLSDAGGLGLCVAAAVAQAHGGRVSVRTQEGMGNAFLLEFPMNEPSHSAAAPSLAGRKALVVDDEAFLLECLCDAIQTWGGQVTSCATGAEAVEELRSGAYDLIVSDIRMPGLSGIELFKWIQEHRPEMVGRILYTTGDAFDPQTRSFLEEAGLPHLGKPFDLKKLKQALQDLLAKAD